MKLVVKIVKDIVVIYRERERKRESERVRLWCYIAWIALVL
jgi:hypothetical protein